MSLSPELPPILARDAIERSTPQPNRVALLRFCIAVAPSKGLLCEFGVHKGESLYVLAEESYPRVVYGFDSFEGLPEDWNVSSRDWRQGMRKGDFGQGPGVRFPLTHRPQSGGNIRIVEGWFDQTLPPFLATHQGPVAFAHLDCDLHSSATVVLDGLEARMVVGTVIQFDEFYNFVGAELHESRAFADFVERTGFRFEVLGHCPRLSAEEELRSDGERTDRQVAVRLVER